MMIETKINKCNDSRYYVGNGSANYLTEIFIFTRNAKCLIPTACRTIFHNTEDMGNLSRPPGVNDPPVATTTQHPIRSGHVTRPHEFTVLLGDVLSLHPDAVFVHAVDGTMVDCNENAVRATGFPREELLARRIDDFFCDDFFCDIASYLSNGGQGTVTVATACLRCDGGTFPASVTTGIIVGGGEHAFLTSIRDLSDRDRLQQECERLEQQLLHSQKLGLIGELAGGITHYYNNIFTGIMGTLAEVQRTASPDMLPLLKRARRIADLASGFSRRLLAFSRNTGCERESTDIGALVSDVEDFARITFERDITVEVKKSPELGTVIADPAALHHLLLNLMVNARDALREKRDSVTWDPALAITVTVEPVRIDDTDGNPSTRPGRYVRIRVTDTGIGMDADTRERIFEPFFTTKAPGVGTGLGLATVYDTVHRAGGWIELESERGVGTTFTVYLPTVAFESSDDREEAPESLPCGTETLLLVDDDDMIRTLGSMTLERQGYTVLPASDGREGLSVFMRERSAVRLVILDLMLPELPGREVLSRIRQISPDIRVIVSTGQDFTRDSGAFADLRADHYLAKPFTVADLAFSVRNVLDR